MHPFLPTLSLAGLHAGREAWAGCSKALMLAPVLRGPLFVSGLVWLCQKPEALCMVTVIVHGGCVFLWGVCGSVPSPLLQVTLSPVNLAGC